ncbi:efflux RND transporter periplasmic adaptor subunit [Acinetobacter johnsonii]|uniref:efflux RND transporter periplasmic adaptor subunit n=1 Tax=Acinetobacter johnsonii TaxID=40214 RepID=UPI001CD0304B|nr:efflux RND transporter periplasmic adaptor subunit [Acinetobacter johnsonii]UBQ36408.1 efflux RND transporter periplasmic adaptor subunit [Acinetobacter johnsonii]
MSEPLNNNNPTNHFLYRRTLWIGLIIVILLLGMGGLYWKKAMSQPSEEYSQWDKPVPVRVVPVQRQDLQVEIKAIGTVVPTHTVNVQTQVSGVLKQIYFKEGQTVQKGQLLAKVDPAPFQVALAQAEGTQQQNLAQLRNAETELARYQLLFKQDSIAKQQVEQQQALVNQLEGQIQANRAQIDAAKLQLSYTKIYSPINGRVGFQQKDAGNLIQANDTIGLVSITQVHPIYVQFSVAEHDLTHLHNNMKQGHQVPVKAWDKAEQKQLAVGHVQALDNQIDANTGTLKIKAVFDNRDDVLFPNQFVNVRLNAHTVQDAISIPSDAVQHGAKGTYVYIVNPQKKAEIRMLTLGLSSNGQIQVLTGLNGTEQVVLEGIDRLAEGKEVQIVSDQPQAMATSKPAVG